MRRLTQAPRIVMPGITPLPSSHLYKERRVSSLPIARASASVFLPFLGSALGLESLSCQEARTSCCKQASSRALSNGVGERPREPALTSCSGFFRAGTRVSFKKKKKGPGCPVFLNVCPDPQGSFKRKACLAGGSLWFERSTFQC